MSNDYFKDKKINSWDEISQSSLNESLESKSVSYIDDPKVEKKQDLKPAFQSRRNFIIGSFWLVCTITSSALIGPLVLNFPAKSAYVAMSWRTQSSIFLSFFILLYHYCSKEPGLKLKSFLNDHHPKCLLQSAFMAFPLFSWVAGLILGCSLTLTSHADVLFSSPGVFILLFALLSCQYVHKYEIFGYLIFSVGVLIMLTDPYAQKKGDNQNKILGDLVSFLTAFFGAVYATLNEKLKRNFSEFVFLSQLFIFMFIYQIIFIPHLDENELYFSMDPEYGIFGWFNDPHTFTSVNIISFITSIVCNFALLKIYEYWTLDIVAIAYLTEPYLAQGAAILLGQDEIPGIQTDVGIIIITLGILLSIYGTKIKAKKIMKISHLEQRLTDMEEMKETS